MDSGAHEQSDGSIFVVERPCSRAQGDGETEHREQRNPTPTSSGQVSVHVSALLPAPFQLRGGNLTVLLYGLITAPSWGTFKRRGEKTQGWGKDSGNPLLTNR